MLALYLRKELVAEPDRPAIRAAASDSERLALDNKVDI
jgi:hypothetical protein